MTDEELWGEQRKAFRFWVGKLDQDQLFDVLMDVVMALDTDQVVDVRDICQDVLKRRAKDVLKLHDPKVFAEYMKGQGIYGETGA